MQEAMMTALRERQKASVEVEKVVEAQSGLREWSVRESEGENSVEVRERRESFSEIQIGEAEMKTIVSTRIASLDWLLKKKLFFLQFTKVY